MPISAGFVAYSMMGRCSWVRFLSLTTNKNDANLVLLRRNPVSFQATQRISQGEQIRLFIDPDLYHSVQIKPPAENCPTQPLPSLALPSLFGFPPKSTLDLELQIRQQLHKVRKLAELLTHICEEIHDREIERHNLLIIMENFSPLMVIWTPSIDKVGLMISFGFTDTGPD